MLHYGLLLILATIHCLHNLLKIPMFLDSLTCPGRAPHSLLPWWKKLVLQSVKEKSIATLGLHLEFSAKLKILPVPACKMEPRSGYIMQLGPSPTHPPDHRISWKSILDSQQSRKSGSFYVVRCPHPIDKVCAVSPPQQSVCGVPTLQVYDFPRTQLLPPQKSMCGVPPPYWHPVQKICAVSPPPGIHFFCAVSPPQFSSDP